MQKKFRIGQIVPSSNTTMETEIPAMLRAREGIRPERFSFHSSRMRMKRALPVFCADHEGGVRKQQLQRLVGLPRCQQAAGMVEMKMRKHDDVDVFVAEASRRQRFQQHVMRFNYAVTLAQLRLEKRANAGFEQHVAAFQSTCHQAAASERNGVAVVRCDPFLPDRLGCIAEHRAAIEALRIAQ